MENPAYDRASKGGQAEAAEAGEATAAEAEESASEGSTASCGEFQLADSACQVCVAEHCCDLALECVGANELCGCFVNCITGDKLPAQCQQECQLDNTQIVDPLVGCMLQSCEGVCVFGG
jgi:hypothetical protein